MSYVLNTADDRRAMLKQIGVASVEDLFGAIPEKLRLRRPLAVPRALTETELTRHLRALNGRNRGADDAVCFLGGGAYDHFIPSVVDAVASRSEFYTAYTPYQAEASQGSLQAFFEFQTPICQPTGLDVAHASLYDGGSAVAEAALMALTVAPKRHKIVIAESIHPEYRQSLKTYVANLDAQVVEVPTPRGFLDPDDLKKVVDEQTSCVFVQHPNFFGCLEEPEALGDVTHAKGAMFVVSYDPISLGLLKRPGQYGADIAIAEGQSLGNYLCYGGPTRLAFVPFRVRARCRAGWSVKPPTATASAAALTLQTREQHIRREKATSNICTNQGLMAAAGGRVPRRPGRRA